jgi:E3 ubiquitin-protein ligase HECTD2
MERQGRMPYLNQADGSGSNPIMEEYLGDRHTVDRAEEDQGVRKHTHAVKALFKPVEDYIIATFGSYESVNSSFSTLQPNVPPRTASEGNRRVSPQRSNMSNHDDETVSGLDAKTLLLGDFAENGSWWTGGSESRSPGRSRRRGADLSSDGFVTGKSPRIDWSELNEWYYIVLHTGKSWQRILEDRLVSELHTSPIRRPSDQEIEEMQSQIHEAQIHTQRVLLKAAESLLKRPGRPLLEPADLRFLLIILANPLLYPSHNMLGLEERPRSRSKSRERKTNQRGLNVPKKEFQSPSLPSGSKGSSGQHSGIIKRILGLLSNVPNECHHHLVSWLARYSNGHFHRTADLIGSFVTYRLTRQHGKRREVSHDPTAGLVPNMGISGRSTSAALHAALGVSGQLTKKSDGKPTPVIYNDDWQIRAAARVMALVFAANNSGLSKRGETRPLVSLETGHSAGLAARERAYNHGQILPTSDFYNTLLDYSDLVADFEAWEARRGKFAFCQYPFFLSIWAKIQIMEHDARRQMEVKAREAFFDSIMTHKTVNQYLVLQIRRDCLVEDSLKGVSEVVGSGGEEIKKGLRIEFRGEEGIDAGGLRKEWFLLLVRDVFNPEHGQFLTSSLLLDNI